MSFPTSIDNKPAQAALGRCKRGHTFQRDARSRCRECDRLRAKDHPQKKEYRDRHRRSRIEVYMLQGARRRARDGGFACTITLGDIAVPEFCPLLGLKLELSTGKAASASPSLDKIRPELGYVPGNVWVISHRANELKRDATLQELQMLTERLASVLS